MANIRACLKSESSEWTTPRWLFDALNDVYGFTLDPASTHENALCAKHYTAEDDGLAQDWTGERNFLNPPYGREIGGWVEKAATSAALTVCLLPARTDTRWWQTWCVRGWVRFLPGRLKFGGAKSGAPFPSAIVVFDNMSFVRKEERE